MSETTTRVACIGASITFGRGLANRREECYPAVLQSLLGEQFTVRNFGYSGATAGRETNQPYWQTASFTSATRFDSQVAIVSFGVNDAQYENLPNLARFDRDLADLIEHFRDLPARPTVLLTLPLPVFEPCGGIDISTVGAVIEPNIQQVADALAVPTIDTRTPFLGRGDWFPDNLHPNAKGARLLAETVHTALVEHDLAG